MDEPRLLCNAQDNLARASASGECKGLLEFGEWQHGGNMRLEFARVHQLADGSDLPRVGLAPERPGGYLERIEPSDDPARMAAGYSLKAELRVWVFV